MSSLHYLFGMRCIHCLEESAVTNEDHVFPDSWYPDTTPPNITKWTAPSCIECNTKLGNDEDFLFSRLALSARPDIPASSGLANRALRIFGVRAKSKDPKELARREKYRLKIVEEINSFCGEHKRIASTVNVSPSHGPAMPIKGEVLERVYRKIIHGCEYIMGSKRYIDPPYELRMFDSASTAAFEEVSQNASPLAPLGPGFEIKRLRSTEDPLSVFYVVTIWDTFRIYALIADPVLMGAATTTSDRDP